VGACARGIAASATLRNDSNVASWRSIDDKSYPGADLSISDSRFRIQGSEDERSGFRTSDK
jgi:hypothetical protein